MNLSEDVAFALHEQWRQTRLQGDGSYEPRWKKIKDEAFISKFEGVELPRYVRKGENGYEIDIANACYLQLSSDWQNENKAAAEVVAKIVESGAQLSKDEIGEIIHNAWLERNPWAKDGELGVPFAKLPKEEQDKDMVQYDVALTMSKARILLTPATLELESAVDELERLKEKNENAVIIFNGHRLYSMFDTPDTCFLKVCGMTMEEFYNAEKQENLDFLERYASRFEHLIYKERIKEWHDCAKARANGMYNGKDFISAVKVIEALEQGATIEEATKIAERENLPGRSKAMMMRIVARFSKRGPEFFEANNKDISPELQEYLNKTKEENKRFEKNSKKKSIQKSGTVMGE